MFLVRILGNVCMLSRVQLFVTPTSSVHGILQARILERVSMPSSGRSPYPGVEPTSPIFQADSSSLEPSGKPILGNK